MKPNLLLMIVLLFGVSACGGESATTTPEPPTVAPTAVTAFRTAIPVVSTRTDRRASTLAPTGTPSQVPSVPPVTDTPTLAATFTVVPSETATRALVPSTRLPSTPTRVAGSPTPKLAPAVYVTALQIDPPAPKPKPAQFVFHVSFLNTVGEVVNYPRWRVLIFPKGQTKVIGDPQGASKTIANADSRQDTGPWSINAQATCEAFVAQPIWEREDGKQVPFLQPDGRNITIEFQVCP